MIIDTKKEIKLAWTLLIDDHWSEDSIFPLSLSQILCFHSEVKNDHSNPDKEVTIDIFIPVSYTHLTLPTIYSV